MSLDRSNTTAVIYSDVCILKDRRRHSGRLVRAIYVGTVDYGRVRIVCVVQDVVIEDRAGDVKAFDHDPAEKIPKRG